MCVYVYACAVLFPFGQERKGCTMVSGAPLQNSRTAAARKNYAVTCSILLGPKKSETAPALLFSHSHAQRPSLATSDQHGFSGSVFHYFPIYLSHTTTWVASSHSKFVGFLPSLRKR